MYMPSKEFIRIIWCIDLSIDCWIDHEHGLTEVSREEALLKKVLHENSDHTIVLMDHSKFGPSYYRKVVDFKEIDALITDQPVSENIDEICYKYDVQVLYE